MGTRNSRIVQQWVPLLAWPLDERITVAPAGNCDCPLVPILYVTYFERNMSHEPRRIHGRATSREWIGRHGTPAYIIFLGDI